MNATVHDVVVIGAGVVGAAIARRLSHLDLSVVLIDAAPDVGAGTSKANTAILHTGFDATPGSMESRLVADGYRQLGSYCDRVGIAREQTGALLVAWDAHQLDALPGLQAKAVANGYLACRPVPVDELYARERLLGPGAHGALEVPGEGIVDPWTPPIAFATEALRNGVAVRLGERVLSLAFDPGAAIWTVSTDRCSICCRYLVNAAGLGSDHIDAMAGHHRFTITPRRGQLVVFDKLARPLVSHILLPVPTKLGKGVLVAPTVLGNVMLGPTAEDLSDRGDTASTADGMEFLLGHGRRIMPMLMDEEITAVYCGLRAATEHSDYQLFGDGPYVCVGGIRSTGLTAAMAIADETLRILADNGMRTDELPVAELCDPGDLGLVWLGEDGRRGWCSPLDEGHGRMVCHCEKASVAEVMQACRADLPAVDLDGVRRRTRALAGRCQGFHCLADVASLLADARGVSIEQVLGVAP